GDPMQKRGKSFSAISSKIGISLIPLWPLNICANSLGKYVCHIVPHELESLAKDIILRISLSSPPSSRKKLYKATRAKGSSIYATKIFFPGIAGYNDSSFTLKVCNITSSLHICFNSEEVDGFTVLKHPKPLSIILN